MADTFRNELTNTIRNGFCTILGIQQNYYGYIGQNPFAFSARLGEAFFGAAYRMFCNQEPPDAPPPPFEGGQCNTVYALSVLMYNCVPSGCGNDGPFAIGNYTGPVTSVTGGWNPAEGWGVFITANGTETFSLLSSAGPTDYTSFTVQEVYLTRIDGLADDCGNPPPPIPEPDAGYNEGNDNITYTNNDGLDVTVPLIFIFAPVRVNASLELTVPIRIDLGGVDIQIGGDINLNTGDINLKFGNRNYSRDDQPSPDSFKSPDDTPDIPPDVPTPILPPSPDDTDIDTTTIIRGGIVTVTGLSPNGSTIIFQDDNPDIYVPNLGYISFLCAVGDTVAWTEDIPVKSRRHLIECPWSGGAIAVRGTPRAGVTWSIVPVYGQLEESVSFMVS